MAQHLKRTILDIISFAAIFVGYFVHVLGSAPPRIYGEKRALVRGSRDFWSKAKGAPPQSQREEREGGELQYGYPAPIRELLGVNNFMYFGYMSKTSNKGVTVIIIILCLERLQRKLFIYPPSGYPSSKAYVPGLGSWMLPRKVFFTIIYRLEHSWSINNAGTHLLPSFVALQSTTHHTHHREKSYIRSILHAADADADALNK